MSNSRLSILLRLAAPVCITALSTVLAGAASPQTSSNRIRLVGDVHDRQGRLVPHTSDFVLDTESGPKLVQVVHGHFEAEDLAPGPIAFECRIEGYRPQWRAVELRKGEVEHREDFELDTAFELDVRALTSDGRDLSVGEGLRETFGGSPLELRVSRNPPPERWDLDGLEARVASHDAHVQARYPRTGAIARLEPQMEPPYYVSADVAGTVLASVRVEARVEEAVLRIPLDRAARLRSSFACRVSDGASKAPLAGVTAQLVALGTGWAIPVLVSDAAGQMRGDDLPVGRFRLDFVEANRAAPARTVELLPGRTTDLGTIEMEARVEVAGRTVDAGGKLVSAGFRLIPCRPDGSLDESAGAAAERLSSGSDGSFRKRSLTRSRYVVASDEKPVRAGTIEVRPRPIVVDLRNGPAEDLVVMFDKVRPVAVKARSTEVRPYEYRILTKEGAECERGQVWLERAGKIRLVPGDYKLLVGPDAAHLREIPFVVGSEATIVRVDP